MGVKQKPLRVEVSLEFCYRTVSPLVDPLRSFIERRARERDDGNSRRSLARHRRATIVPARACVDARARARGQPSVEKAHINTYKKRSIHGMNG